MTGGCLIKPAPGTRVRFSPYFVAHVPSASRHTWTVVECSCGLCLTTGRHVAVNEPAEHHEIYDGVPPERRPRWRHIHFTNLQVVYVSTEIDDEPPPTPRSPR